MINYIERRELTIRKWPLLIVAAVLIIFVYVIAKTGRAAEIRNAICAAFLLMLLFFYYVLSKNKIVVDNDGVTQQLFFGKRKIINWTDITATKMEWHYHLHGAMLLWGITAGNGKQISFQPSYYSRNTLRFIAESIALKRPDLMLDKRIIRIAAGNFPWYIF